MKWNQPQTSTVVIVFFPLVHRLRMTGTDICLFHSAAIQALKRKKRYEKNLGQIDGTLSTIELQREALENASTNTEVLKAMHTASKSLKAAHNDL